MSDLIVLGLIPGTQLQITFILWIILVTSISVGSLIWIGHRLHIFRNWIITVSIMLLTRRQLRA
jgi:hypothetical protein